MTGGGGTTATGDALSDAPDVDVLEALLSVGRWADAAAVAPDVSDLPPVWSVAVLFAAGYPSAATALLERCGADTEPADLALLLRSVSQIYLGDTTRFGDAVTACAGINMSSLIAEVMLRAAQSAGQPRAACHYARLVLNTVPGDIEAVLAVAQEMVFDGDYSGLIYVLDKAERYRHADGPAPVDAVLAELRPDQARALATIGKIRHRESDPTVPVDEVETAARQRWRAAYRTHRRRGAMAGRLGVLAGGVGLSIVLSNPLPVLALAVGLTAWKRTRPLPGLDQRTTRIVRALDDPLLMIKYRRYQPIDVITFVGVLAALAVLLARLPHGPDAVGLIEVLFVLVAAAAATRGRRRWVRHNRTQLVLRAPGDDSCRCLDVPVFRGAQGRRYADVHLLGVGFASAARDWQIRQCLLTAARFLDVPSGELLVRLLPR